MPGAGNPEIIVIITDLIKKLSNTTQFHYLPGVNTVGKKMSYKNKIIISLLCIVGTISNIQATECVNLNTAKYLVRTSLLKGGNFMQKRESLDMYGLTAAINSTQFIYDTQEYIARVGSQSGCDLAVKVKCNKEYFQVLICGE